MPVGSQKSEKHRLENTVWNPLGEDMRAPEVESLAGQNKAVSKELQESHLLARMLLLSRLHEGSHVSRFDDVDSR